MIMNGFDSNLFIWHTLAILFSGLLIYLTMEGVNWVAREYLEVKHWAKGYLLFSFTWPPALYAYIFDSGFVPFDSAKLLMVMACGLITAILIKGKKEHVW